MTEPRITHRKITDFRPDAANANRGTERGHRLLDDSVTEVGLGRSILTDKNGIVIAGNKTQSAAVENGFEDAIEIETDGKTLVVVKRTDLDLNDTNPNNPARRAAYYDNRAGQLNLDFDPAQLFSDMQSGVDLSKLWSDDELAELLAGVTEDGVPSGDPGAAIDHASELREHYGVERGQLWLVGRHRILCGDAYSENDRARLLDGRTPDMLHIDPPYGINIVKPENVTEIDTGMTSAIKNLPPGFSRRQGTTAGTMTDAAERSIGATHRASRTALIIQPNSYPVIEGDDRLFDPIAFLDLAPIVIMWGANYYADKLPSRACWICWDKREDITRNDFADGELAWTNMDKPMRIFHHLWNGLHKGSQHGERRTHPTEKPVALFASIGQMYADKGLWLDLFGGTGAQVVAAQQTGATCYLNEIEPLYVATILDRLEKMHLKPERLS